MSPAARSRLKLAALLLVAIVIQTTFASDLRVDRVAPDLMILVAVCAGLEGGAGTGAVVGFLAGLLADLSLTATPMGLSSLAFCLTGWAVGHLRSTLLPEGRLVQPLIGMVATAGGLLVYVMAAGLSGQTVVTSLGVHWLLRVVVVESLWNAVLVIPTAALMDWALRGSGDRLARAEPLAGR